MKKFIILTTAFSMLFLSVILFYEPKNSVETAGGYYNMFAPAALYWGSQGQDVRIVQDKLSRWKFYDGPVDGVDGAGTYRAVRKFQAKHGLKQDGVVGPSTAKALGMPAKASAASGINQKTDEYLLARTIHGEARGEPYIGKVAIAAVALNRVRDSRFPNTLAGVIYQPLAFTAVADGQINLTPNKDAINAARDALNGWDPTYGTLYYWNPATATSKWIWSRKVTLKIGKHWFGI